MRRNRQHGFTLVEMLVVIGIIGALAGLVLTAVLGAQATANDTSCKNNLRELGRAMALHETQKGEYPGFQKQIATKGGDVVIGWVPQLFRFMGRTQQYKAIQLNLGLDKWQQPYTNYYCPAEKPDIGAELNESGNSLLEFPGSYAMTCGQEDDSATTSSDTRRTAIGHNHLIDPAVKTNVDDIVDGLAETALLTENIDLANWTNLGEPMQGVIFTAGAVAVDDNPFLQPLAPPTDDLAPEFARPSSYHTGGFNVAYADGHVDNFAVDDAEPEVSYRLFRAQMTPNCYDDAALDEWSCRNAADLVSGGTSGGT